MTAIHSPSQVLRERHEQLLQRMSGGQQLMDTHAGANETGIDISRRRGIRLHLQQAGRAVAVPSRLASPPPARTTVPEPVPAR